MLCGWPDLPPGRPNKKHSIPEAGRLSTVFCGGRGCRLSGVQNATNFREYVRGRSLALADWSTLGAADPEASVLSGYEADGAREVWLRVGGATGAPYLGGFTWNAADGDPGRGDQEVRLRILLDGSDGYLALLRGSVSTVSAALASGYAIRIDPSAGTFRLMKWASGVASVLATVTKEFPAGSNATFLVRASGTSITFKGWLEVEGEPSHWDGVVTDASYSDGSLGFASDSAPAPGEVLFFSYGTGGDAAPAEDFLPPGIDEWASHESDEIEITAELEMHDPDSGVTERLFLSTTGRRTDRSDYPPSRQLYPILTDPGNLSLSLAADLAFAGEGQISLGALSFRNPMIELGGRIQRFVDVLPRRTLAGRPVTVRAGLKSWPRHRWFQTIFTGLPAGEPESGDVVTCAFAEPYRRLQNSLTVGRNVGIETCLTASGAGATAPYNAAYDVTSFAVFWRFRYPFGMPGTNAGPRRGIGLGNEQFALLLESGTGKVWARASCAGAPAAISLKTTGLVLDDDFHSALFAVDGARTAYLLVDGELIGTMVPPAVVDLPAATGIDLCINNTGESFCDVRFYNFCPEIEDARAATAARSAADDPGVVSMWRCDDSAGAVVTDYGPLANHVTLTGTLGVQYFWNPSYLGQESSAGTVQPMAYGSLFNAPAPLADHARPIYRMADRDQSYLSSVIKARGLVLTAGTDYAINDNGTVTMTGAQSEPVTYDIDPGQSDANLGGIVQDGLIRRAGMDRSSLDLDSCTVLGQLLAFDCAFYAASEITGSDFLGRLLGPAGGHYRLDRDGRLLTGVVLPPITPGPYAGDPAIEFSGLPRSRVLFDGDYGGDFSGSFTMLWWMLTFSTERRPEADTDPSPNRQVLARKGGGVSEGYQISLYQPLQGSLRISLPGLSTSVMVTGAGAVDWGVWTLGVCRYDQATGSLTLATRAKGDSGKLAARAAIAGVTGSVTVGTGALQLGGALNAGSVNGSVQHFQIWDGALTDDQVFAVALAPPRGGVSGLLGPRISFYAPLNEGRGTAVADQVSLDVGRVHGARWAPRAVFDFRRSLTKSTLTTKRLRPAWDAKIKYGVNQSPMADADIAALGVTPAERSALKRPYRTATAAALDVRDAYKDAIELLPEPTALMDPTQAGKLARLLRYRLDPKRLMVRIDDAPRMALPLGLTDEVWAYHPDLPEEGAALRVVGFTPDLARLRFAIDGWGHPLDPVTGVRLVDEAGDEGLADDYGSPGLVE